MTTPQPFDKDRAVVLSMDIVTRVVNAGWAFNKDDVLQRAGEALMHARKARIPVIHIVPASDLTGGATPASVIHPMVAAVEGEMILPKRRMGAFSTTGLDVILRGMGKDTLVLMGLATSGVVLSTHRWAFDIGYKLVVVKDACSDRSREVHKMLTEGPERNSRLAFIHAGPVITAQEFGRLLAP